MVHRCGRDKNRMVHICLKLAIFFTNVLHSSKLVVNVYTYMNKHLCYMLCFYILYKHICYMLCLYIYIYIYIYITIHNREEEKSIAEEEKKKKKVWKSTNLPTIGFFWRADRRPGPPWSHVAPSLRVLVKDSSNICGQHCLDDCVYPSCKLCTKFIS
jgi:hypothetical protein